MRQFVRHPSDIPVDVRVIAAPDSSHGQMENVSLTGLCCRVDEPVEPGSHIEFAVPSLSEDYTGEGVVMWCQPSSRCFQLGIRFASEEHAYRARMVEQLCQIEAYRRQVARREGRQIDGETAAMEWIGRYAEDFQRIFPLA